MSSRTKIAGSHVNSGPFWRSLQEILLQSGIRVSLDDRSERMQAKVRDATLQKVPFMAIIGDKEVTNGEISVRSREGENLGSLTAAQFLGKLQKDIETKR